MTPETSVPGAKGKGGRRWYLPAITRVVAKLTPAARTRNANLPGLEGSRRDIFQPQVFGAAPIGGRS